MLTGNKGAKSATPDGTLSKGDSHSAGKTTIEDLEFAINLLKVKLRSAMNLSEKARLYNQIRTLQDNISRIKGKGQARS